MHRSGFSLVETMIASLLLVAGLLAIAGTARVSYRLAGLGSALSRSAQLAEARAARLQASGCQAASGTSAAGAFQERWTVRALPGLREVAIEVEFRGGGLLRVFSAAWAQVCLSELP